MPPKITPIRRVDAKQPFDDPEWFFELKHNGFRALAYIDRGRCRFVSRNDHEFPHWPKLAEWIAANLRAKSAILDGELACLNEEGNSQVLRPAVSKEAALLLRLRLALAGRR